MTKDAAGTANRKRPALHDLHGTDEFMPKHHHGAEDIGLDGITAIEFSGHHHDDGNDKVSTRPQSWSLYFTPRTQ